MAATTLAVAEAAEAAASSAAVHGFYLENVVGVELVDLVEYGPEVGRAGFRGDDELHPRQRLEALQLERVRLELFYSRGWYRRNLYRHGVASFNTKSFVLVAGKQKHTVVVMTWILQRDFVFIACGIPGMYSERMPPNKHNQYTASSAFPFPASSFRGGKRRG